MTGGMLSDAVRRLRLHKPASMPSCIFVDRTRPLKPRIGGSLVSSQRYPSREAAKRDLFATIEGYYNRVRLPSA